MEINNITRQMQRIQYETFLKFFGRSVLKCQSETSGSEYYSTNPNGDCGFIALAQCIQLEGMEAKERIEFLNKKKNPTFKSTMLWGSDKGVELRKQYALEIQQSEELKKINESVVKGPKSLNHNQVWMYQISADPDVFKRHTQINYPRRNIQNPLDLTNEQIKEVLEVTKNGEDRTCLWCGTFHFAMFAKILKKHLMLVAIDALSREVLNVYLYSPEGGIDGLPLESSMVLSMEEGHTFYLPECVFQRKCLVVVYNNINHFWFAYLDAEEGKSDEEFLEERMNTWKHNPNNMQNYQDLKDPARAEKRFKSLAQKHSSLETI